MDLGRRSVVEWVEAGPEEPAAFTPAEQKYSIEAPIKPKIQAACSLVDSDTLYEKPATNNVARIRPPAHPNRRPTL